MKRWIPALLFFLPTATAAVTPIEVQNCSSKTIVGTWSLVSIHADQPGAQDFYRIFPNEVMRFGADGSFIYVAGKQPYTKANAARSLNDADKLDGVTYHYKLQESSLIITRDGVPFEGFTCKIQTGMTAGRGGSVKGDMILTNLPGRPGLVRVQRRMF